jgi:hypothetical protein
MGVEDEPLVGLDLVDMLEAAGAYVVSARGRVKQSHRWIASKSPQPFWISTLAITTVARSASIFGSATYPSSSIPDTAPL